MRAGTAGRGSPAGSSSRAPIAAHLAPAGEQAWTGLETAIALDGAAKAVAVRALDANGHVLGTSNVTGAEPGKS